MRDLAVVEAMRHGPKNSNYGTENCDHEIFLPILISIFLSSFQRPFVVALFTYS